MSTQQPTQPIEILESSPSPINRLPQEVLAQILSWTRDEYFGPDNLFSRRSGFRRAFVIARHHLASVCRRFRSTVNGNGEFWASCVLSPSESREAFDVWAPRVKKASLQFHIMIRADEAERVARRQCIGIQGVIDFLLEKSAACIMLSVRASNHPFCIALFQGLRLDAFPVLDRLILTNSANGFADPEACRALTSTVACPPELRAVSFPYHWGRAAHFCRLVTLVVSSLVVAKAPSIAELHGLLTEATSLERLSIDHVLSAGTTDGLGTVHLMQLDCLHYAPAANEVLGQLIALIHAPRLEHLSLVVLGDDDMVLLLGCRHLFRTVRSLTIDGFHFDEDQINDLYESMGEVTVLDLSLAVREFCTALGPDSVFWWGVERATFRDVRIEDVERLIAPGVRPTRLEFLGLHYTYHHFLASSDEQWVVEQVDEADVRLTLAQRW
ncbi:hypothetical protein K438DRAFT_1969562 [Mycena galopus ATCC 62051]|nr:hypothetical protein K438DRAFT_1969562 [Mycena galopus ATCC 62051]